MKIILHADDFGFDRDTTEATIELLEKGVLTSATIMVNMPASDMAIAYAKAHPEKSFGVHLTYVDKLKPVSDASKIPTMVDELGLFLDSNVVRRKAMFFYLLKKDIVTESLAQIAKLKNIGVKVSHLDSHGHLHKFPSFLLSLKEITRRSGVLRVRRVQNVFFDNHLGVKSLLNSCFDAYIKHYFKTTDYFYMSANTMDKKWAKSLCDQINKLPQVHDKVMEVGVHPGNAEDWRIQEKADVLEFYQRIQFYGHEIINWNDI